jgi:archaellum component FlaC
MAQKPVYVKLDEYKNILALVDTLKAQVNGAKETLDEIRKLKQEEDVELEIWQTVIHEIENRVNFIDNTITEPEEM